jgi:lipoyl(octanoyl) transferase
MPRDHERERYRVPRQVLVYLARHDDAGGWAWLLLRRRPSRGGFWQGISGAPLVGEDDQAAAQRELREETGLELAEPPTPVGYRYLLLPRDADAWRATCGPGVASVPEEVFVACAPDGFEPALAADEHDAYDWCALADALARLPFGENREALRLAAALLATGS